MDAALCCVPSCEKPSSSCLSDSGDSFQRLSLSSLIRHLGSGGQGHLAWSSPSGPEPSLRQNRAPGTSEGRGLCTLPAHTGPPSHLGGLWHPQAQPSHPLPP